MTPVERNMLAAIASGATAAEVAVEFGIEVEEVRALLGEEPEAKPAPKARRSRAARAVSAVAVPALESFYHRNLGAQYGSAAPSGGLHTRNHGHGYASIVGGIGSRRI